MNYYLVISIVILILIIIVIYTLTTYNSLAKLNVLVKEGFSTMDVSLKKRWDLVPKLVEVVKSYAKHEKDILEEIVSLRNDNYDNMSNSDKINTNAELDKNLSRIMLLLENYPDLKASDNFLDLSNQLVEVENDIAEARRYYNTVVRNYNNKVKLIPSNIVALLFGFKEKEMFEADLDERNNVDLDI